MKLGAEKVRVELEFQVLFLETVGPDLFSVFDGFSECSEVNEGTASVHHAPGIATSPTTLHSQHIKQHIQ